MNVTLRIATRHVLGQESGSDWFRPLFPDPPTTSIHKNKLDARGVCKLLLDSNLQSTCAVKRCSSGDKKKRENAVKELSIKLGASNIRTHRTLLTADGPVRGGQAG